MDTKIIAIKSPMKEVVVVVLFHNSFTEQLLLNDILYSNCDLTRICEKVVHFYIEV